MKPPLVSRRLVLAVTCLVSLTGVGQAAEEPTLELPKYTVTTGRELPTPESWHYARIDDIEILSSASSAVSQSMANGLQDFIFALDIIWPGVRRDFGAPCVVVVCGRFGEFERFQPDTPVDFGLTERFSVTRGSTQASIVLDQTIILQPIDVLHRNYVNVLLSGLARKPAPWLTEGLARLIAAVHLTENSISIGQVIDPNGLSQVGGDFNVMLQSGALLPLAEFFSRTSSTTLIADSRDSRWAAQCFAFVHWGLYGDYGKHQKEFLTFIRRLDQDPLTEALFKECFKQDYREMQQSLRNHVDFTRFKIAGVRAGKGEKISWPPAVELRDATQAEVGRLQAAAFTLAGRPGAARDALLMAYLRGERDPALLAALGEAEANGGDHAKARKLLEAADAAKVVRPRAYVELARLRLEAARTKPEAAAGKLSTKQTADVLEPLFTARSQSQALPETYELIAATWAASISSPAPAHLAVLDEGVRLFPRDAALVYADAALQAKAGQFAAAGSLIRLGLRITTSDDMRAKFELLQAALPAPPPAQPQP
ncbi:MAG: hypothetical protein WCR49_04370 [Opitutae bacterium]